MSTTSDNITNWKELSDVDYFTQFIKSYLAFNAWMRTRYSDVKQDRQIINKIKRESNEYKRKIINLLSIDDADGERFRSYISSLHYYLERVVINNNSNRITFYNVFIDENTDTTNSSLRSRINYSVTTQPDRKVKVIINDASGNPKYTLNQSKYNLQEMLDDTDYQKLSPNQQLEIKELYKECNPFKTQNIVSNNNTGLKIGQFYFVNDTDIISKAIIEVLYGLRCTLFHGELLPNKDTNQVYEYAFQIKKMLIQVL